MDRFLICFNAIVAVLWCCFSATPALAEPSKPNIMLILADDFGWANLGYHRRDEGASEQAKKEAHTPNLDSLIDEGIYLSRHYAYKICSPSRSSLQSGRLAVHVNTENTAPSVYNSSDPVSGYAGIPRNMTGIAEKMKAGGYATAMVGKWDAGMATPEHTPQGRGYDEWYGYFQHANNYWSKGMDLQSTGEIDICLNKFTDLSKQNATYRGGVLEESALDASCATSTEEDPTCYEEYLFKQHALDIVDRHDFSSKPLFFFYSFHIVHTPLDCPRSYLAKADDRVKPHAFDDEGRRSYSGMVHYMDDAVGELVKKLKDKAVWSNTLLVFMSDNGGPIYIPGSANNHPLKGGKYSDWEGGVRTNAFLSGGFIPAAVRGSSYDGLVSIADWYGAFAEIAKVDVQDAKADLANEWLRTRGLPVLPPVDSTPNLLKAILSGDNRPVRRELHLSENALIAWPYKLVTGQQPFSKWTGEIYPNCSKGADKPWFPDFKLFNEKLRYSPNKTFVDERVWIHNCSAGCMFNILDDPYERKELSNGNEALQSLKKSMRQALDKLNKGIFQPYRGEMQVDACRVGLKNGGYYGPFISTQDYYTGPFPAKPFKKRVSDAIYRTEMEAVNTPLIQKSILSAAQLLLPKFTNALQRSLDQCNTKETLNVLYKSIEDISKLPPRSDKVQPEPETLAYT